MEAMRTPSAPVLVGRERELGLLRAVLEQSLGSAAVAVVRGDAGTGKSALLAGVGRDAEDQRMLVLRATGVQAEARMPFAGLHQLLRPVISRVDGLADDQRQVLLGAFGTPDFQAEVFLVGLAALTLLSDIAAVAPVAVLIDDAQWIDSATIEVLAFTARRLDADPVALIVSHRSGFPESLEVPGVTEIELHGLEERAAAELLDASFPDLGAGEREAVLALAAGNPLALLELPKALAEASSQPGDDIPLPRRLERAFAGRTLNLPQTTQWALLVAALDERLLLEEVLAATSMLAGKPATLDDLASAESVGLVRFDGQAVRFCHPLMSSAVRQTASMARRRDAHAAIADTLHSDVSRNVWHRAACALGPDDAIATQLEAIGMELRQRDGSLAVAALRRAGALSSTPARRGRLVVAAAELALELGRDEEVAQLLERAVQLPLDAHTRHSMLWLREALKEASGTGTVRATVGVAERLIAEGDVRIALRALFTAAVRCYMFKNSDDDSAAVAAAAESLDLPADDPSVAAIRALATPSTRAAAVIKSLEAITPQQVVVTSPDAAAAAEALHLYAIALTCIGEFQLGVGFQDAAISGFRTQGRLGLLSRALGSHSIVRLTLADWRAASQAADECLRLSGYVLGSPGTATDGERVLNAGSSLLVLGVVAANRGQLDAAAQLIEESVKVQGGIGSNYTLALIAAARASLSLAAGRSGEAFEHAARLYDPADAAHHVAVTRWATVVRDLADAALASGNAQAAVAMLEPLERTGATGERRATAAYVDAVLSGNDFVDRYQTALALAPPSVFFQSRLQLAYGSRLRRERRSIDARAHLRSAADGFEAVGATPWSERAREELRASGETVRHHAPDRRDELSPQEMQIAQLAAEGLSNRQIAARLFVSHRTVGSHLYKVFPKLGISSRGQLAAALRDAPRAADRSA
jgi:DNA-binding CsgD family transcriptional regulator